MTLKRLGDVQWGVLAHATLRYSVLWAGAVFAVAYGLGATTAIDLGLLALLSIFLGLAVLVVALNAGPRTSSHAFSVEPGAGSTPDRSGFIASPIGSATVKMVFLGVGLAVWGGVALVLVG